MNEPAAARDLMHSPGAVPRIEPVTAADGPAVLRLNLESERFLSPLSPERLRWLAGMASYCKVVRRGDEVAAFLLAFREGTAYDSENYRWFAHRYPAFLYIDRVVVAAAHHGRGLGAALYADLFAEARRQGVSRVTCEFDIDPPNAVSARFHARFGFREVGTQLAGHAHKRVSLQEARCVPA